MIASCSYADPAPFVSPRTNYRNAVTVGESERLGFVKYQGLSRGYRNALGTRGGHRLDGRHADHRHVKTHILIGLGDLDHRQFAFRKLTGTADRRVGAFHSFDGDTGFSAHNDRLAEVEPGDLAGDMQSVGDVLRFEVSGLPLGQNSFGRKMIAYKKSRVDQLDAFGRHFVGDSADQCVGISPGQTPEHLDHSQIGDRPGKQLHVLHLSGHDRLFNTVLFKERDHLAELTNADPSKSRRKALDQRIGLFFDRNNGNFGTCLLGSFENKKRKLSVSGDQSVSHRANRYISKDRCRQKTERCPFAYQTAFCSIRNKSRKTLLRYQILAMRIIAIVIFVAAASLSLLAQAGTPLLTEPSLSPDKKEIAFVSGSDIWSVPAEGGVARLLVSHPASEYKPLFSPDGRHLAFMSNRTGNGDIYVLEFATGTLRRVTFDDSADVLDGWSRDGKWLYFSSTSRDIAGMNDIYRVPATGGTPMQVSSDRYTTEYHSTPLADGSFIFAARGIGANQWWRRGRSHLDESEIWQKSGESYTQLTQRGAKQLWPMATADGSRIFFVSDRGGQQNIWALQRGGQPRPLTAFTDGRVLWPNLAYDGSEIVFERNFRIWKMRTDGGRAQELAVTLRGVAASPANERVSLSTQVREMSLSPDGKKVAVVARGEVFAASSKDGGEAVRVTRTAAPESDVSWSADSRKLIYSSERSGAMSLYQYDFSTEAETQLTRGDNMDIGASYSPDGKSIAFIRNARSIVIYDVATKAERELCKLYTDMAPLGGDAFKWSPDSKWIAFLSPSPETRSYTNVHVIPAAGGTARAISFLANSNAGSLVWGPDGSYILYASSQRTEDGSIARIDLKLRTPKFREDQFRDLFKQENPQQRPGSTPAPAQPTPQPSPAASPAEKKESNATEIVFDDIRKRLSFLTTGVNNNGAVISPDGKTLLILASAEGQFNLYTMTLDELANDQSARQLTSTPGFKSQAQFSPDGKEVYYVENGRISIVSMDRREVRPLNVGLDLNVDFAEDKMEVFKQGWRYMRDHFYDDKYHGADWNTVRTTYEPMITSARTMDEVRRLMSMMVGELNASHLGVSGQSGFNATTVGKLGLRFDRAEFENNGRLKITEIITLSPAAVSRSINVGDFLITVDDVKISPGVNLDEVLEGKVGKRVEIEVSASPDGANKREVILKPISTGAEKNLLYRQWVESNREYVARISGGKIGYVHLPDMGQGSLNQLYVDLDTENQSKDAVVVDIRNNNGGFVNPYVVDVLARRGYLTMRERGMWNVPGRTQLGQRALEKPTVLLINQHSLSDAEDLTEGYKTLKLGKVVGEPTSGWIIFTWNASLFDGTTIRLPRQLILGSDGKNMELNPRTPDIASTRPIGESLTGKDSQLDAAVKALAGN